MDVGAAFVAHAQASELMQPCDRAFDDLSQRAQAGVVVGAAPRQERLDPLDVEHHHAEVGVVRLVGRQRVRAAARGADPAAHGRDRVHQRQKHGPIVDVGRGDRGDQRRALSVRQQVMFGAGFAAVGGVWAGGVAPPTARTEEESATARDQSICPAALSVASRIS